MSLAPEWRALSEDCLDTEEWTIKLWAQYKNLHAPEHERVGGANTQDHEEYSSDSLWSVVCQWFLNRYSLKSPSTLTFKDMLTPH